MSTGLQKCNTKLRGYNRTNIPQLGSLDTPIKWKDEETKEVNKMDTTFYIADTPGPVILELSSFSRLRIVNLNCSVQLRKHGQPVIVSKEREKDKQDMKNLKPIMEVYMMIMSNEYEDELPTKRHNLLTNNRAVVSLKHLSTQKMI